MTIRSEEVREALKDPMDQILGVILETLEHCPPELAGDICSRGVTLAGGGALLRGLDTLLAKETRGIPIHIADDPLTAVVRGTGIMVENLERFRPYLDSINVEY
jgi:rod shape-determining protein MreB